MLTIGIFIKNNPGFETFYHSNMFVNFEFWVEINIFCSIKSKSTATLKRPVDLLEEKAVRNPFTN
jgi:hypothetical protein